MKRFISIEGIVFNINQIEFIDDIKENTEDRVWYFNVGLNSGQIYTFSDYKVDTIEDLRDKVCKQLLHFTQ